MFVLKRFLILIYIKFFVAFYDLLYLFCYYCNIFLKKSKWQVHEIIRNFKIWVSESTSELTKVLSSMENDEQLTR